MRYYDKRYAHYALMLWRCRAYDTDDDMLRYCCYVSDFTLIPRRHATPRHALRYVAAR